MFVWNNIRNPMPQIQQSVRVQAEPEAVKRHDLQPDRSPSRIDLSERNVATGANLAGKLWSMEDAGIVLNQQADSTWLGREPFSPATDEILLLADMSFTERTRFFFLKDRELTEADLEAMTPEDRAAIEEQIRLTIMEALGLNRDDEEATRGTGEADSQAGVEGAGQEQGAEVHYRGQEERDPLFAFLAEDPTSREPDSATLPETP